ncbi:hypothetical protein QU481_02600 [Crenobacter sp. SG2303]|uniref:Uncharacterized protein n=1 Tax=Crenobacter oryzisoli TaxID=3056844 RepID=A0ABT7XJ24_9NEIS|nr:hypothetical protein [Crenobacter sp. SG2303]MDN0073784.1 hypothetical protein [Crenobacter sp. SG2303]
MKNESISFIMENFHHLKRAEELLAQFEDELKIEGQATVAKTLTSIGVDTSIRMRSDTWKGDNITDNIQALRFFPANWGNESNVVLAYYQDATFSEEGSVGFFIRAYVRRGSEKQNLDEAMVKFTKETNDGLNSWIDAPSKDHCWTEGKSWVGFGAYPKEHTKDGAIVALADLAAWMQKNVF